MSWLRNACAWSEAEEEVGHSSKVVVRIRGVFESGTSAAIVATSSSSCSCRHSRSSTAVVGIASIVVVAAVAAW